MNPGDIALGPGGLGTAATVVDFADEIRFNGRLQRCLLMDLEHKVVIIGGAADNSRHCRRCSVSLIEERFCSDRKA